MQSALQCQVTLDISIFIYNSLNKLHNQTGGRGEFSYNLRVTEGMYCATSAVGKFKT
jgi:hypothetical protein